MSSTSSIKENYEQRLLRETLQALADKEESIRAAADNEDPSLLVNETAKIGDRELHLAIGDMMEQLISQGDEEIRLVAETLFHFRHVQEKHYPIRCYEAIIALYKVTFVKEL
ncbi:MAG: hypothetical protein HC784_17525 [Hydrococcus sp. CSU_1_8]|nr:hypothetical protein [Hydrococcus sp. CSU_1_8]